MPREPRRRERSIDWLGAAVLAAASRALLLGLVWGGHEYPWSSAEVVGVLAAAAVLLVVFALLERRVPRRSSRSRSCATGLPGSPPSRWRCSG